MSIEDITSPRVFKFLFDVVENDCVVDIVSLKTTGVLVKFLDARFQGKTQLSIWAEVSLSSTIMCRIVRTGDTVPEGFRYLSTLSTENDLIYHIYAKSDLNKR
ncbi:MAG: hypothetical protein MSH58_00590 [Clostridiales bacterium]|nr:hypothetical protein [Clostridiales bacterium]